MRFVLLHLAILWCVSATFYSEFDTSNAEDFQCQCVPKLVWNDVIVAVENSDVYKQFEFQNVIDYVKSVFGYGHYNLQSKGKTSDEHFLRLGLISYGKTATLIAPLGSLTKESLRTLKVPFKNDKIVEIQNALELAHSELNKTMSVGYKVHARKVIVLLANTYDKISGSEATQYAEYLKQNEYIIIVNQKKVNRGGWSTDLQHIASDGYYFSDKDGESQQKMNQLQCNANCFCPINFKSYQSDQSTGLPIAGCYWPLPTGVVYELASERCEDLNGIVATTPTAEKQTWIGGLTKADSFWIGLKRDGTNTMDYHWEDGTDLGYYHPWQSYSNLTNDTFVYVKEGRWIQSDGDEILNVICQVQPCNSMNICNFET